MNSSSPDAATDLLGRGQSYDDTFLRKRVTCLGSGLLLCFIIGGAGLGISIIVLLKFDGTAGIFPQYAANQTMHMNALKVQIMQLQKQVEALNNEIINSRKSEYPPSAITGDEDLKMLNIDFTGVDSTGRPVNQNENVSDHSSHENYVAIHEHHSIDSETSTKGHEHHHHEGHKHNAPDQEDTIMEREQDSITDMKYSNDIDEEKHTGHKHHHSSHSQSSSYDHHSSHDHHSSRDQLARNSPVERKFSDGDSKMESPSINELLCDDSDHCLPTADIGSGFDGSGEHFNEDGSLEGMDFSDTSGIDNLEGSGSCIQYPRPICPRNFNVCYTKDPCPIPICCLSI